MAVDTPATIAVIGAGPIGLEAALYARFLGYAVDIYERGRVCESWRAWSHLRLRTPWFENRSPLGEAALRAQYPEWYPPAEKELLTAGEMLERYYTPLAESDLLADGLHEGVAVVSIERPPAEEAAATEEPSPDPDADEGDLVLGFRLELAEASGNSRWAEADVVIDASGLVAAAGAPTATALVRHDLPDALGADRAALKGRNIVLEGTGLRAAYAAASLLQLAADEPGTRVTWLTPGAKRPILPTEAESEARWSAAQTDSRLALITLAPRSDFHWRPAAPVTELTPSEDSTKCQVSIGGDTPETLHCDILFLTSVAADTTFASRLAATPTLPLFGPAGNAAKASGPERLVLPEPDFYVLGAKSYGDEGAFRLAEGLRQIRDLFTIIGDRPTLDLYAGLGR